MAPSVAESVAPQTRSLLVGSLATASDNTYQSVAEKLATSSTVERQLLDRVIEGAASLTPNSFNLVHVVLTPTDAHPIALLSELTKALVPGGTFIFQIVGNATAAQSDEITGSMKLSGLVDVSNINGDLTARKPSYQPTQVFSLKKTPTAPTNGNGNKLAMWTMDDDDELEDESTLLDADDLVRPTAVTRPDDCEMTGGKRKACKNCTCGRAEAIKLDIVDDLPNTSAAATSSCGNCSLGDAFRCSGCPYLGMPAFRPGQAISLGGTFAGDDI